MELDKNHIAQIIKNRRIEMGFKQSELAEKIGISDKHLSKIETGKYLPALDTFLNLLEVLNLSLGDFGFNQISVDYPSKQFLQKIINTSSKKQLDTYVDVISTLQKHI